MATYSAELTPEAQQLYTIAALSQRSSITLREKAILKGLVLDGDSALADIILGDSATDFPRVLELVRRRAQKEAHRRFEATFADIPTTVAKTESRSEREARGLLGSESLVYGEVDFESFTTILRSLRPRPEWSFADLGSGAGRAVLAAVLLFDFQRAVGYERLGSLNVLAEQALAAYHTTQAAAGSLPRDAPAVEFHNSSFLDADWSGHDVVFANSTCFEDSLMAKLSKQAEAMKGGAYFISFTRPLDSECFRILSHRRFSMSWGPATVFVHQRVRPGEEAAEHHHHADSESSGDADTSDDDGEAAGAAAPGTPPLRAALPLDTSVSRLQAPLGSPSSPQGNSLLRAKAARAARGRARSALSRPATATGEAPKLPPRVHAPSAGVAFEMAGMVGQSSPQGTALLARKARRR